MAGKDKTATYVLDRKKQFYYLKYKHPDIFPRSKHAFDKLKRENHDEFLKLINILPDKYKEDIL